MNRLEHTLRAPLLPGVAARRCRQHRALIALSVVLALSAFLSGAVSADTAPIAFWHFDGNLLDAADSHNGAAEGSISYDDGHDGQALYLDGNSYVSVPDHPLLSALSEFSLDVWVKLDGSAAGLVNPVVSKLGEYGAIDDEWALIIDDAGRACFRVCSTDAAVELVGTGNLVDDAWHHLSATFSSTRGAASLRVDDIEEASAATDGIEVQDTEEPVRIGGYRSYHNDPWEYFHGFIDELQIAPELPMETVARVEVRAGDVPVSIASDPADGSSWTALGSSVFHLSAAGVVLSHTEGFASAISVSVDPDDSSCWVGDAGTGEVVHLSKNGAVLLRAAGYDGLTSVAASPTDGACWIAVAAADDPRVVHLSAAGAGRPSESEFTGPSHVAADSADGSCWVIDSDANEVICLSSAGEETGRVTGLTGRLVPISQEVDGQYLVLLDDEEDAVVCFAPDGTELFREAGFLGFDTPLAAAYDAVNGRWWVAKASSVAAFTGPGAGDSICKLPGFSDPASLAVNVLDGSCWVADSGTLEVALLDPECSVHRWSYWGLQPTEVAASPADGSCWVADSTNGKVEHVSRSGVVLWSGDDFSAPAALSVDGGDGSCWIADAEGGRVVHLDSEGAELWSSAGFASPQAVAANSHDGSCWVADTGAGRVIHLDRNGDELSSADGFVQPQALSVYPGDGSCWAADGWTGQVVHLRADGTELARIPGFSEPQAVCVDLRNGSCWVADSGRGEVVKLSSGGAPQFSVGGLGLPVSIAVNPVDGSCWVADSRSGQVIHLSEEGERRWWGDGFGAPESVSASARDGSCWVADPGLSKVVRLVPVQFPDVSLDHWAFDQVTACFYAGVVQGFPSGLYEPDVSVLRDQMAVYIARVLAGGDDNVPPGPVKGTFPDVRRDYWAYNHIEYCYAQNVVQGYPDGKYQPTVEVKRDAMAVYIARAMVAPTGDSMLDRYEPAHPRNFPDVPSSFWAYNHVEFCVEHEVVQGYPDGLYHPEYVVTRDQMAVYIARAFLEPTAAAPLHDRLEARSQVLRRAGLSGSVGRLEDIDDVSRMLR